MAEAITALREKASRLQALKDRAMQEHSGDRTPREVGWSAGPWQWCMGWVMKDVGTYPSRCVRCLWSSGLGNSWVVLARVLLLTSYTPSPVAQVHQLQQQQAEIEAKVAHLAQQRQSLLGHSHSAQTSESQQVGAWGRVPRYLGSWQLGGGSWQLPV